MTKQYKIRDGTSWDARTSDEVIDVLEKARRNHIRVHISLGYTELRVEPCGRQGSWP